MRKLLALGCCTAYVAFGFVAGAPHVHEAADHHDEMRGLHLDHAHLGEAPDREPAGHPGPAIPEGDGARTDARHVGHHEGHHDPDALYLTITAQRSLDPGPRVGSALVAVGATLDPAAVSFVRQAEPPGRLRGPPDSRSTSPRAPPA